MNTQERIKEAEKAFANHTANYSKSGKVAVLDWKNKNGSSNYGVRYVMLDNVLYISGDLGSAVVQLKERATMPNISRYHLDYFVKRIECSTDLYDFDPDDAEKEMREYIYNTFEEAEYPLEDDEKYKIELLIYDLIEKSAISNEIWFDNDASKKLQKIGSLTGYWFEESEFLDFGKSVSDRVIHWYTGFRMAYQNLRLQQGRQNE